MVTGMGAVSPRLVEEAATAEVVAVATGVVAATAFLAVKYVAPTATAP